MQVVDSKKRKREILRLYNKNAEKRGRWLQKNRYYHEQLSSWYRFNIPKGSSVLEIGCATGQLLAALEPAFGVGVDISEEMVKRAREKNKGLHFIVGDAESLYMKKRFDFIILSDCIGHFFDIEETFSLILSMCRPDTRVLINYYNFLWEPVLKIGEKLGLKMPENLQNWLPVEDIKNFLFLSGFEVVKKDYRLLFPFSLPIVSSLLNRFFARLPAIKRLSLVETIISKPFGHPSYPPDNKIGYTVSVVIPCRNERGNIEGAIQRTPKLGAHTELIFVDGNSEDSTVEEIEKMIKRHKKLDITLIHQGTGSGKGDAVRKGFAAAKGDILMILDADLTVPPEDLTKFFNALVSGKGEFINGTRLVYPMEKGAMRFLNLLGNKFFSLAFTWLLEQRFRDTLCGTKALFKKDYEKIAKGRAFFGDFDPFGDFDLIFGASKCNLKMVEIPVSYRERKYGTTNISRFRHGILLFKMCWVAFRKLKL